MKHNQLTTRKIAAASKPGYYGDGAGLYMQVSKQGTKSWIYRFMLDGRVRDMGIGGLDVFSLKEARERAREFRKMVKDGIDPIEERNRTRAARRNAGLREAATRMTFADCAKAYLNQHADAWGNPKHRAQWVASLKRANEAFGALPVGDVDVDMVIKFLAPIWKATPDTGARIRGRVEKVLDWATASKFRTGENPARWRGHLEHLLKARPKARHHAALPFEEMPEFMAELRSRGSVQARALEFCILTAVRSNEAIGSRWGEISQGVWIIPAERMKAGREHMVPLSTRAIEILEDRRDSADLLFPGAIPGKPINHDAMRLLLKEMNGGKLTVHGFRSSFRDWAGERTTYQHETIEFALAHHIPDQAAAAYRRYRALEKRRKLMEAWAQFCSAPVESGKVVALHG
jgi:integrase